MVDYLQDYAVTHAITPDLGVEVHRVRRHGKHFVVETSRGTRTPRVVVVATGYNGVANIPDFPRLNAFGGEVIHTAAYKNPKHYAGKRVLVVGCGNSGAEIALNLAE